MTLPRAKIPMTFSFPEELVRAIDKARGTQFRQSWVIEALREKLERAASGEKVGRVTR